MGVAAGLYMCDAVKKFTFAISSPDEFLLPLYVYTLFRFHCDIYVCYVLY